MAVPRTRSRRLDLQPHVDLAMSAATLDPRQRRWRTRRGYLFNHQALAKVLRGKRVSEGRTPVLVQAPMNTQANRNVASKTRFCFSDSVMRNIMTHDPLVYMSRYRGAFS